MKHGAGEIWNLVRGGDWNVYVSAVSRTTEISRLLGFLLILLGAAGGTRVRDRIDENLDRRRDYDL